jgi:hypothetical protein
MMNKNKKVIMREGPNVKFERKVRNKISEFSINI